MKKKKKRERRKSHRIIKVVDLKVDPPFKKRYIYIYIYIYICVAPSLFLRTIDFRLDAWLTRYSSFLGPSEWAWRARRHHSSTSFEEN